MSNRSYLRDNSWRAGEKVSEGPSTVWGNMCQNLVPLIAIDDAGNMLGIIKELLLSQRREIPEASQETLITLQSTNYKGKINEEDQNQF